ncbi:MAG: hypothetical protein ABIQ73_07305 [Acidimicrobiales bacterium]
MSVEQPIGDAVLYVSSNVQPQVLDAFNDWCDTIHHFDTMRIDGFLSLRRLHLVDGVIDIDAPEFPILTLYQVEKASDADFSTPSYAHHSATYTPPPAGVVDAISYERTVYQRDGQLAAGTQPVGDACVTLVGVNGPWLAAAATTASETAGFLCAYRVANEQRAVLLVDVEEEATGREVLAALSAIRHDGQRHSVQLFSQVFPRSGVLVRDRVLRT